MPTIRNTYATHHLRVAGHVIPPKRRSNIPDDKWQEWLQEGGSSIAARFLEVVPDGLSDEVLAARDEGQDIEQAIEEAAARDAAESLQVHPVTR